MTNTFNRAKLDRKAADLAALLTAGSQPFYAEQVILFAAGCGLGGRAYETADALGMMTGSIVKFKDANQGRRALNLADAVRSQVGTALNESRDLLPAKTGQKLAQSCARVGHALLSFADGLDASGLDPDQFSGQAADAFERLGRHSALLLELSEALDDDDMELSEMADFNDIKADIEAAIRALDDQCRLSALAGGPS